MQGNKRPTGTPLPTGKKSKLSNSSRIPVSSRSTDKSSLKSAKPKMNSTRKEMSVVRETFQSSDTGSTDFKSRAISKTKANEMTDIFVWKSVKPKETTSANKREIKLFGKTQIPRAISADAGKAEIGAKKNGSTQLGEYLNVAHGAEMFTNNEHDHGRHESVEDTLTAKDLKSCLVEVKMFEERGEENMASKIEIKTTNQHRLSDDVSLGSSSFEKQSVNCPLVTKLCSPKRGEVESKENGKSERNDRQSGSVPRISKSSRNVSRNVSHLRDEVGKGSDENAKLRAQIEKLSGFVESSEDLRERSELLLNQQKEQLENNVRDKEGLKNKVCCLEELRRNVQRKLNEQIDENKSLKSSIRHLETKLLDERENVKVIKKECSFEVSKNAELEIALETVLEQLHGGGSKLTKSESSDKDWDELAWPCRVGAGNKYANDRMEYRAKEVWGREKKQFVGKMKLLEMDKTKLRSHINLLEDKIVEHERVGVNLKENNDVLEFRITELECQVFELSAK